MKLLVNRNDTFVMGSQTNLRALREKYKDPWNIEQSNAYIFALTWFEDILWNSREKEQK